MSADYKNTPLEVCASSTGGPAVSVGAELLVDDKSTGAGKAKLQRVDQARQCAELTAQKKAGSAKIRLTFASAPFIGNGEFTVRVELRHPAIETGELTFDVEGEARDVTRKFRRTFDLP